MSGSSHSNSVNDIDYPTREEFRAEGKCGVHEFKDAVCGYDGSEGWCDRTRKRCAFLGNVERFDCAMPAIVPAWKLPVWEVLGGVGMCATLMLAPPWWIAGTLYSVFALLIVPAVRQELYYRYLHRSSEQDQNTST